jgi:serine phosphatase RsbU (regulator of sigma subunit)
MTVDLGGFDSSYYAGLNLVIIGVNLLLPWSAIHTAINTGLVIAMYLAANLIIRQPFETTILINNLFFLFSTGVMAVGINYVKHRLVKQEFFLRIELQKARDSLWSEMEIAKRIQTALLPDQIELNDLEIASVMYPAKEVGGDYYDIIESANGDKWITIGDVSGHGVDSGLIMMMAQTSILTLVNESGVRQPSSVLAAVNSVIKENIARLGSDHYMTMSAICFRDSQMTVAGKHQDILIYRSALNSTEAIPTQGTWLGVVDDISGHLKDIEVTIEKGDVVLLFTDGITEAVNKNGEMFGQRRLEQALDQYANLPVNKISSKIIEELTAFQEEQYDDITLVVVKKAK